MPKSTRYLDLDLENDRNRRAEARRAAEARYARLNPSFASKAWSATSGLVSAGINKITGKTAREAAKAAECEEIERVFKEGVSNIGATLDGITYTENLTKQHMVGMGIIKAKDISLTNPQKFKDVLEDLLGKGREVLATPASKQGDARFNEKVEHAYWSFVYFYSLVELYHKYLPMLGFMDKISKWRECNLSHTIEKRIKEAITFRNELTEIIEFIHQERVMLQLEELKQQLRAANGNHNPPRDGGKRRTRRHHSRRHRSRRHRSRRCRTN